MMMSLLNSAVALCAGVTITACLGDLMGVEPQACVWAAGGAGIGTTFYKQMINGSPVIDRVKMVSIFLSVALISAGIGTVIAQMHFKSDVHWRNVVAAAVAIFFMPLVSLAVSKLPELLDIALRKFGLKQ